MTLTMARAVLQEYGYLLDYRAEKTHQNRRAEYYYALRGATAQKLFACSRLPKWGEKRFRKLVARLADTDLLLERCLLWGEDPAHEEDCYRVVRYREVGRPEVLSHVPYPEALARVVGVPVQEIEKRLERIESEEV